MFCDYFTVGCKTEDGFTVILVERCDGLETKSIKTSYSPTAGTAFVTFDNVKVPVENTLGEEGGGIFVMLSNFNHERWTMACKSHSTFLSLPIPIYLPTYTNIDPPQAPQSANAEQSSKNVSSGHTNASSSTSG